MSLSPIYDYRGTGSAVEPVNDLFNALIMLLLVMALLIAHN